MKKTLIARFEEKIAFEPMSGCWIWLGSISPNDYGKISVERKNVPAHRVSCLLYKGPIPKGREPDHLCRLRSCINPDHLEVVTRRENILRGKQPEITRARHAARSTCKHGHLYTSDNTRRVFSRGYWRRECKTCRREIDRRHYYRTKQSFAQKAEAK